MIGWTHIFDPDDTSLTVNDYINTHLDHRYNSSTAIPVQIHPAEKYNQSISQSINQSTFSPIKANIRKRQTRFNLKEIHHQLVGGKAKAIKHKNPN